jgi:hypothetical protein
MPSSLEERSLPSGIAPLGASPVVFPRLRYERVVEHIHLSFIVYARFGDVDHLIEEIRDVAVMVPFGQVDGLGRRIGRIVDRMEEDLADRVPRALRSAQAEVVAATRAQVQARVRAGDVVVR